MERSAFKVEVSQVEVQVRPVDEAAFIAALIHMPKSENLTVDDVSRLLGLIIEVAGKEQCSYSEAIERIVRRNAPTAPVHTDRVALGDFLGRTRRLRMKRNEVLGAPVFRDPSFDMLLELFATDQRGEPISVTSLCYASGVPMTTALRHLVQLEKHGLLVRHGDRRDHRRCYVRPTPRAIAGLEALFSQWLGAWSRLMDSAPGNI
jgi:DNA-binding transcriptional ArsR family regulator